MAWRRNIAVAGLGLLVGAWVVVASGGSVAGLAAVAPALLLLAPLLLGSYPGETGIARLRSARGTGSRRARAGNAPVPPRPAGLAVVRGGLLLARRIAVRPPPARPAHA